MKLFICDYIDYPSDSLESFVVEAESEKDAESKAIDELKTLGIPKRYLFKIEEIL